MLSFTTAMPDRENIRDLPDSVSPAAELEQETEKVNKARQILEKAIGHGARGRAVAALRPRSGRRTSILAHDTDRVPDGPLGPSVRSVARRRSFGTRRRRPIRTAGISPRWIAS